MRALPRWFTVACAAVLGVLFVIPASADEGGWDKPQDPPGGVDALLARLQSTDPRERSVAAILLKNLAPVDLPAVETASAREDLAPDAKAALKAALPTLRGRARVAARAEEENQDKLRAALGAYEHVGKKDPKWDAAVKEGITLFNASGRDNARTAAVLKKAVDAGCDDPFVQCLLARAETANAAGPARDEALLRHHHAAIALAKTAYPGDIKLDAAGRYIQAFKSADPDTARICSQCFPEAVSGTGRPWRVYYEAAELAAKAESVTYDARTAMEEVVPAYEKARPDDDPGPHLLKGIHYINYAWDARGGGVASTVTPQGWKLFNERLAVARHELEAAFERDADDPRAPSEMIIVCRGEGAPRPEMEKWFRRAMAADPDNFEACTRKMTYLFPRWLGRNQDMIAFGRECAATQNWWGPLPEISVDVYAEIAKNSLDDAKALYSVPGTWLDMRSVYGSFLELYPHSPRAPRYRNLLAKWACHCGKWKEAALLFQQIGDNRDVGVFRSKAVYNYWRRKATRNATPNLDPARQVRVEFGPSLSHVE